MKENSINKKEVDNGIKINIPIISNQEIENTINTENLYDKIAKQIYHDREMIILQEFIKKLQKENEILKEEKEQAWEEWNNLEQGSYGTEQKLKQQIKELKKENEELKYKIKGQECVIETQVHNEEVYESIFEKLEKENKELKKQVKSDVNTIF